MNKNKKNDVRNELAEMFIAAIKEKPLTWHCGFQKIENPVNGIYGSKYGKYNRFYLTMVMIHKGYKDNRWYPQSYIFGSPENRQKDWDDPNKIKVKKGEKPVYVDTSFFVPTKGGKENGYKVLTPNQYFRLSEEEKENYIKYPARKPIPVYNGEQLTGITPYIAKENLQLTRFDVRSRILRTAQNMGVAVTESPYAFTPSYSPMSDRIQMPPFESYDNEYEYFATLLHELAHSTGHETRLKRDMILDHSSPEYAKEELRAEIASCFTAQEFGFELSTSSMDNHKAYIQSWIELVEKDGQVLISAISDAQSIADYINEKSREITMTRKIQLVEKLQQRFWDISEYYPEYSVCLDSQDFDLLASSLIDYTTKYNRDAYETEFIGQLGFSKEELCIILENEGIDAEFLYVLEAPEMRFEQNISPKEIDENMNSEKSIHFRDQSR